MKTINTFNFIFFLILLVSCSSEEMVEEPEPKEEIAGDYTGTWDDNIYTSFPISAKLSEGRINFLAVRFSIHRMDLLYLAVWIQGIMAALVSK